jgi:transcriptional regulator with GAF, ATPase, and Fis domain
LNEKGGFAMSGSSNGFNSRFLTVAPGASNGSADHDECRQLVHALRRFTEALGQAVDAFEQVDGSQNETGNFYDRVSTFEALLISQALRKTQGHQRRAAQILGLRVTTLNTMIKRYKLD